MTMQPMSCCSSNVMLLEHFCDIEQRLVCRRGDNIPTLHFQNCRDVHLISPPASVTPVHDLLRHRTLIDNVTAYLFEAEFVSAGLARVVNPFPAAIFIHANVRPDVLASTLGTLNGLPQ